LLLASIRFEWHTMFDASPVAIHEIDEENKFATAASNF
jgi:hypothetical protein